MPRTDENIISSALALRNKEMSWRAIAKELNIGLIRLRSLADPDFVQRRREYSKHQRNGNNYVIPRSKTISVKFIGGQYISLPYLKCLEEA